MAHTRGIANHNPGNLRYTGTAWKGLASPPSDRTPWKTGMCRFSSAVMGLRAMAKNLLNYQDRYGLTKINQIIPKWAPEEDNNNEANYISRVVKRSGLAANQELNLHDPATLEPLMRSMIAVECNSRTTDYFDHYSPAEFAQAFAEAGLEVASAPLPVDKEPAPPAPEPATEKAKDAAQGVAIGGGAASIADQVVQNAAPQIASGGHSTMVIIAIVVFAVVVAVGFYIWKRKRKA